MKKSKLLSILLAIMMLVSTMSCLTVIANAAVVALDGEYDEEGNLVKTYWELDDSGVLNIYTDCAATWSEYREQIAAIVLGPEVTKIPDSAFVGCYNLQEVDFTNVGIDVLGAGAFQNLDSLRVVRLGYVRDIKEYAFYDCDNLEEVYIGGGLEYSESSSIGKNIFKSCDKLSYVWLGNGCLSIGYGMFDDCISLVTVEMPDSIVDIGKLAFDNCTSLINIVIPDSVESVGDYAFNDCISATSLYIGHEAEFFGEFAFGNNTSLVDIEIKCAMPVISYGMFNGCTSLKSISLPQGVQTIGAAAFMGCTSLESINIPTTTTMIGESAFDGTALTTVTIPWNVVDIGAGAFTNCAELTAINVDAKNTSYTSVDGVLYDISLNTLLCCPAGKTGTYTINKGTTTIANDAFIGCKKLAVVEIPSSVEDIANNAFNACGDDLVIKTNCSTKAALYAKIHSIKTDLIHSADAEWVVVVEPTCETAGTKEKRCSDCNEEIIDTAVIDPTGHSFDAGTETTKATCETAGVITFTCTNGDCGHTYTQEIPATGHDIDNGTVVLEPTCEAAGTKRFRCNNDGCYYYYDIEIPATGHEMDAGTVVLAPTCEETGKIVYKCLDDDCSYSYEDVIPAIGHNYGELVVALAPTCEVDGYYHQTCQNDGCTSVLVIDIPATGHEYDDGVVTKYPTVNEDGEKTYTCQNEWCADDHANHTYVVVIPNIAFDGVFATNEGAYADEDGVIQNLTWLITDNYHLYIFADGTATEWGKYRNLIVAVTISGDATTVENGSFAKMPELKEANILLNLGTIEAYAFQLCPKLETVKTGSIVELGDFAFYDCPALTNVDIYGGLDEGKVGKNTFYSCENLETVTLGNGCLEIGNSMFMGCTALEEITIPASIVVIGDSAFDGTSLKEIYIPKDVREIQKGVFTNCAALEAINVDAKNDDYFSVNGVLYDMGISSLVLCPAGKKGDVVVWDGTKTIENDAFIGCAGVEKVTIPGSVTEIADNAFNGCSDKLVIACDCDSAAYSFAIGRGINTDVNHVGTADWSEKQAPTCLEDGVKESACSVCGFVYETGVIPALGHQYDAGVVTKAATCEEDGVVTITCQRADCGDFYTVTIPATNHKYDVGVVVLDPTCETTGIKRFTCQNTGCYDYYEIDIPATGHNYTTTVTKAPTCEEEGIETTACDRCGDFTTTAIPATGHSYNEGVVTVAPTCEEDGEMTYTCANCGDAYTDVISAVGHNYVEAITKPATCIDAGKKTHTCSNCGDAYETTFAGEHRIATATVNPTCDKPGKTGEWCVVCSQFVGATTEIPAKGHSYKDGKCTSCGKADGSAGGSTEPTPQPVVRPATPKMKLVRNEVKGLSVTWSAVEGAASYRVYRRGAGDKYWTYITTVTGTSYLDTKATTGNYWRYTVRAVGQNGLYSGYENGIYIKRVDTPAMKKLTNTAAGINVTWSAVSNAKEYRVYRRGAGETTWTYIGTVRGTSYLDTAVKNANGQYFRYTVRAVDGYYSNFESGIYTKRVTK